MSHSSIHVSPGLAQFFHIISGMPWPESDEGLLRDVRDDYLALADDLPKLAGYIQDAVKNCDQRIEGKTADAFRKEWSKFVGTDSQPGPLDQTHDLCTQLADLANKVALSVEYTKWMAIGQLVQLLLEIAIAIAWSVFTGGASLIELEWQKILTRQFLLQLVKKLVQLIVMHTFGGIIGGLLLDAIIQGIQFNRGDRHEWDTDLTKQAAIFGAISGAIGGPLSILGEGLGKLLGAGLSKLFMKTVLDDVIKGLTGGLGKEIGEGAAGDLVKGGLKDLTKGAAGDLAKGALGDLGKGAAGGGLKGLEKEAGQDVGRLLGNEAAERFAGGISKLLKDNAGYLAKGFKSGRRTGAAMGEKFVRQLGDLFVAELGTEIGEKFAREMGEQIGRQFAEHSLKTVAKQASREALTEALENLAKKDSKLVALTPELKMLVDKMPELAGGINTMNKWFHVGQMLGGQLESGVNQYLTEGIYNTIYNGEWQANGMSFVGGFMMSGMHHMIMGLASPLTARYADFVRSLDSSRIEENGEYYSTFHPLNFLAVISTMGGHPVPFPVRRPGHISEILGETLSPEGVLASPEGKSGFNSSVDGGMDPKAPYRQVRTQSEEGGAAAPKTSTSATPTKGKTESTGPGDNAPSGSKDANDDGKPAKGGQRGATATSSADAGGQGGTGKPTPQPRPRPEHRTTVVEEGSEPPLHLPSTGTEGGTGGHTKSPSQPQPHANDGVRNEAATQPTVRTSSDGGTAPAHPDPNRPDPQNPDPNRPDPQNPDPNRPDPQNPDPNRPDPQNPDPNRPDPQNPDPNRPDPQNPLPPATPPRDPKPDVPGGRHTPDTAPIHSTTASGRPYHRVESPEHIEAPAADERHAAWQDRQRSLAEDHDTRLAEAEEREATRRAVEDRLTQGVDRLPRELRPLVTPDTPVWHRAAESMREDIEARPHEREEILDSAADRLELAGGRELALTFAMTRFDRLLADRGLGPEHAGDHTKREIRREATERFRADAEQDVAQLFTARTDFTPERNAMAARALERRLREAAGDLDLRQARAEALGRVDQVVDDAYAQWSAQKFSEKDRALLEAAGVPQDVRPSAEDRDLAAEALRERIEDLYGDDDSVRLFEEKDGQDGHGRKDEESGEDGEELVPVDPTRLGRERLETDFQEALDGHQLELAHDFAVQAVREAVRKRSVAAVDDAAAAWKDTAADQFGDEALRELGLADGPSPRAVAAARADLARRTDRLVAEHTAADRDPARLKEELDRLTSPAGVNRLLALHGAREEALRVAEDTARAEVPHDLGGPDAPENASTSAVSVEMALGPVRGSRTDHSETPPTAAARRVREGYTERIRATFEETFRSLLRDPDADHRTGLTEQLEIWRRKRDRLTTGLEEHVAFERDVLPAREHAAAGYDRLAEGREVPEAEARKLKTEYGGDFFDAYREHWAPKDLDGERWRGHEAANENVFGRRPTDEQPEAEPEPTPEPTPEPEEKPAPTPDTPSGPLTRTTGPVPDTVPDTAAQTPPAVPPAAVPPADPRPLLPASAWADIRTLAPPARMDTVRFDPRVRGQGGRGDIAGPGVREQYEKRQRSLGGLHGADTKISYDVRRFEAQPGHWVTEFTLNLHLQGPDGRPLPADAAARMLDRTRAVVSDRFNERFRLPGGDQVHLRVESVQDAADAHQSITVLPGNGRSDQLHWYDQSPPGVLLHEALHFLGLPDEYVEPARKPGDAFALRRRDLWAGENGVMGTSAHRDDFTVLSRHLQRIQDVLHSGPVLRDLAHGQYRSHQETTADAPLTDQHRQSESVVESEGPGPLLPPNGATHTAENPRNTPPSAPPPVHESRVNVLFDSRLHHVVEVPGDGDRLLPAVLAGARRLATWEHGELTVEKLRELAPEWDTASYQDAPRVLAEGLGIHLVVHEGNIPTEFNSGVNGRKVHVYRDPRPGEGQVAHYSELRPDERRPVAVETGATVDPKVAKELEGRVQPDMVVVTLEPGQPVFRVTDAWTLRGYLLQGKIGAVKNKEGWSQLGPGLYTGDDFDHAANYSHSLSGLPVVMELVLGRKATGLKVKNITEDWPAKEVPETLKKYDFLTDGTQFKFHPGFYEGLIRDGAQSADKPSGLRVAGLKVKEGDSVWNHYRTEDFVPEFEGYLVEAHKEKAQQHPRSQDLAGSEHTPDPAPTSEALEAAPHAAPEDLRHIQYLEHAQAFERRLATHLLGREDVQREVKKAVDLAWRMTTGDKDKAKFGSRSTGTTGMVGTDRHMLQEVVDGGNLRERMALLYNGYTSNHFAKLVRKRELPRPEQLKQERADRHDIGKEVVNPLTAEIKKVYGELLNPPAEHGRTEPFESFRTDEPYGPVIERIRGDYVELQGGHIPDWDRKRVVEAAQKAAERQAKSILETDRHPFEVNPPLGRGEWYSAVEKDGRLGWQPGAKSFYYKLDSKLHQDAHDSGGLVVSGTSGTAFGMLQAVKELARTEQGKQTLNEIGGGPVDFELLRLGLLGWMLEAGDHTFHEILSGSRMFSESLTPEERADPDLAHTDLTYRDTYSRYRFLSPLTEEQLRSEVAPDGLFPDEHLVGEWSADDPEVTGLTPEDQDHQDHQGEHDTDGGSGLRDSAASPPLPADPVAVDLARRHLDAAAKYPELRNFMGWIKGGGYTSKRDEEGMLAIRDGDRYESLLGDVQRFLDHAQALQSAGVQPVGEFLRLYRAVRMDSEARGREGFTELLPASTSFSREFVQDWMSNGGGADNYALFEIRVPLSHPMLALSFPPGHARAQGDPAPVNEKQSEVTLGPSRLTVTGREEDGGFHVIRVDAEPMTVADIRTEVDNWTSPMSMPVAFEKFTRFYSEGSLRAAYSGVLEPHHRITETWSPDGLQKTVRIEHPRDPRDQFTEVTVRQEGDSVSLRWRFRDETVYEEGTHEGDPLVYGAQNIGTVSVSLRSQKLNENTSFESIDLPFNWYDLDQAQAEEAAGQPLAESNADDLRQPAASPPLPEHETQAPEAGPLVPTPLPDPPAVDRTGDLRTALVHHETSGAYRLDDPGADPRVRQRMAAALDRFPVDGRFLTVAMHTGSDGVPLWKGSRLTESEAADLLVSLYERKVWDGVKPVQLVACSAARDGARSFAAGTLRHLRLRLPGRDLEVYAPRSLAWFAPPVAGPFRSDPHGAGALVVGKQLAFDGSGRPVLVDGGNWASLTVRRDAAPDAPITVRDLGAHLPVDASLPPRSAPAPEGYTVVPGGASPGGALPRERELAPQDDAVAFSGRRRRNDGTDDEGSSPDPGVGPSSVKRVRPNDPASSDEEMASAEDTGSEHSESDGDSDSGSESETEDYRGYLGKVRTRSDELREQWRRADENDDEDEITRINAEQEVLTAIQNVGVVRSVRAADALLGLLQSASLARPLELRVRQAELRQQPTGQPSAEQFRQLHATVMSRYRPDDPDRVDGCEFRAHALSELINLAAPATGRQHLAKIWAHPEGNGYLHQRHKWNHHVAVLVETAAGERVIDPLLFPDREATVQEWRDMLAAPGQGTPLTHTAPWEFFGGPDRNGRLAGDSAVLIDDATRAQIDARKHPDLTPIEGAFTFGTDETAVDLARRHLDAAAEDPELHHFMGWIKGGGYTSKRDEEGMLAIRDGDRYESLLGDVQRFLDHAQALQSAGVQPVGEFLRLYRAVRMDSEARGREGFTELLPASTSFSREFVQDWMSNGGGADNYALFEIRVPLSHPMLALSFPPGHTRAQGDPAPVNEKQSEVTLGPSRLTVTGREEDGGFHVIRVDAEPMTVADIRTEVDNWTSPMSMPVAFEKFTRFYSEGSLRAAYSGVLEPHHRITETWSSDGLQKTVRIEHPRDPRDQFTEVTVRQEGDSVSLRWRFRDETVYEEGTHEGDPLVYGAQNIGTVSVSLRSQKLNENTSFESIDLPYDWYDLDQAQAEEAAGQPLAESNADDLRQPAASPPLPDSAASPPPPADPVAVDLARRHLDAAAEDPELHHFMGWIKGGGFTSKRDDEGMLKVREGERYDSLLGQVQRFLDHAQALQSAGAQPAGESLRLYRAVRMDSEARGREGFTELLPASTSFSREFVQDWMSNGGGADNYALFEIRVPLSHPMLALSFPPGHARAQGDPAPVNESQSEVTLGPSRLTVTGREEDGGFHVIRVDAEPMTVADIHAEVDNWTSGTSMPVAFRQFARFFSDDSMRAAYPYSLGPDHRITESWSSDGLRKTVRIEHRKEELRGQFTEVTISHDGDSVSIRWHSSDDAPVDGGEPYEREPMVYDAANIGGVSGSLRGQTLAEHPSFEILDLPADWYAHDPAPRAEDVGQPLSAFGATAAGWRIGPGDVPPAERDALRQFPEQPGVFVVPVHTDEATGLPVGPEGTLSAYQTAGVLADLRRSGVWNGTDTLQFVACNLGSGPGHDFLVEVMRQLEELGLGTNALAGTGPVYFAPREGGPGHLVVASALGFTEDGHPVMVGGDHWREFRAVRDDSGAVQVQVEDRRAHRAPDGSFHDHPEGYGLVDSVDPARHNDQAVRFAQPTEEQTAAGTQMSLRHLTTAAPGSDLRTFMGRIRAGAFTNLRNPAGRLIHREGTATYTTMMGNLERFFAHAQDLLPPAGQPHAEATLLLYRAVRMSEQTREQQSFTEIVPSSTSYDRQFVQEWMSKPDGYALFEIRVPLSHPMLALSYPRERMLPGGPAEVNPGQYEVTLGPTRLTVTGREEDGPFHVIRVDAAPMTLHDVTETIAGWTNDTPMEHAFDLFAGFYGEAALRAAYPDDLRADHRITERQSADGREKTIEITPSHPKLTGQSVTVHLRLAQDGALTVELHNSVDIAEGDAPAVFRYTAENIHEVSAYLEEGTLAKTAPFDTINLPADWYWTDPVPTAGEVGAPLSAFGGPGHGWWLGNPDPSPAERYALARFPAQEGVFTLPVHTDPETGRPVLDGEELTEDRVAGILAGLHAGDVWNGTDRLQFVSCNLGKAPGLDFVTEVMRQLGLADLGSSALVATGPVYFSPRVDGTDGPGHLVVASEVGYTADGVPAIVAGGHFREVTRPTADGRTPPVVDRGAHLPAPAHPERDRERPEGYESAEPGTLAPDRKLEGALAFGKKNKKQTDPAPPVVRAPDPEVRPLDTNSAEGVENVLSGGPRPADAQDGTKLPEGTEGKGKERVNDPEPPVVGPEPGSVQAARFVLNASLLEPLFARTPDGDTHVVMGLELKGDKSWYMPHAQVSGDKNGVDRQARPFQAAQRWADYENLDKQRFDAEVKGLQPVYEKMAEWGVEQVPYDPRNAPGKPREKAAVQPGAQLPPQTEGVIAVLSSQGTCDSCKYVVKDFQDAFPGVSAYVGYANPRNKPTLAVAERTVTQGGVKVQHVLDYGWNEMTTLTPPGKHTPKNKDVVFKYFPAKSSDGAWERQWLADKAAERKAVARELAREQAQRAEAGAVEEANRRLKPVLARAVMKFADEYKGDREDFVVKLKASTKNSPLKWTFSPELDAALLGWYKKDPRPDLTGTA
ncbi:protein-glutamine glutaminase family protein [Kitasatospora sp. NPDC127059]|uniref:WXG100-like domain-containing protein n=1 Tax=unclassified Kitasatospora TaxID=2633591 RepID=UPI003648607A